MVGAAGTCQPAAAARRSQAYDAGRGAPAATAPPRHSPSAARVRGRRAMVEELGVRQVWEEVQAILYSLPERSCVSYESYFL